MTSNLRGKGVTDAPGLGIKPKWDVLGDPVQVIG